MPIQKNQHIIRLIKAFGYSLDGLKAAYSSEAAFRQELLLFAICVPITFMLDVSKIERILMISSLFLLLIAEIINSAIETTIERISPSRHDLSKKAKDLGSAAVLLALANALALWAIILIG